MESKLFHYPLSLSHTPSLSTYSGSISLEELRELLLDDSVLISKKSEHTNPKMVRLKSRSSLDLFQKLVAKEMVIDAVTDALKQVDDDDDAKDIEATGTSSTSKKIENKVETSSKRYSSAVKIAPIEIDSNHHCEIEPISPFEGKESIV